MTSASVDTRQAYAGRKLILKPLIVEDVLPKFAFDDPQKLAGKINSETEI